MEKRKSKFNKILIQYDSLIEEKKTLEKNLIRVFNQIHLFVDHARKIENHKNLNEILILELKILKKMTEFSMDLERFLEDKSVSITDILEQNFDCTKKPMEKKTEPFSEILESSKVKCKTEMPAQEKKNEPFSEILESSEVKCKTEMPAQHAELCSLESGAECTTYIDQSSAMIIPSEVFELECENVGHENGIQKMKNCLDNVSAGLGLNQKSFSHIEDFNEKSSISLIKTDQSDLLQRVIQEGLEIPKSDTPKSNTFQSDTDNISSFESKNSLLNTVIQIDEKKQESTGRNAIITETDSISSVGSQCKAQTNGKDQNECSVGQLKNNDSTALKKLKNYQSKKSNDDSLDTDQSPVISLKPIKSNHSIISKSVTPKNYSHLKGHKRKEKVEGAVFRSSKVYEPKRKMTPKVGDECFFCHIESPSEFYLHIVDEKTAMIDCINEQINEYFKGTVSIYDSKRAAVNDMGGKFCFSYIPDYDGWFRVVILDWCLNDAENVIVQLADYGNKRNTTYRNLRKMIKEISDIPLLAIQCHFPRMFPFGSTSKRKLTDWPEVAVEALMDLSRNNENQNMFKVVYAEKKSKSVAVDLLCTLDESGDTVGQILMDMGIAVQIFDE